MSLQLFLVAFSEGPSTIRVKKLLNNLDYIRSNKCRTSGSRMMFVSEEHGSNLLHNPHPRKELKAYQIKQLIEILEQEGLI